MFTELMPLIKERPVTITVSKLANEQIRVNIVPKHFEFKKPNVGYSDKDLGDAANKLEKASLALNTPLTITGTAAEIDAELPKALAEYGEQITALHSTLDEAKKEIAEASKAADEARKANKKGATSAAKKPEDKKDEKKADDKKTATGTAKAPDKFTLFDTASEANKAAKPAEPAAEPAPAPKAEVSIDEEPAAIPPAAVSADDDIPFDPNEYTPSDDVPFDPSDAIEEEIPA